MKSPSKPSGGRVKPFRAFLCVGTNWNPYVTAVAPLHPQCEGRYEIYMTREEAEKVAIAPNHVVEVEVRTHTKIAEKGLK